MQDFAAGRQRRSRITSALTLAVGADAEVHDGHGHTLAQTRPSIMWRPVTGQRAKITAAVTGLAAIISARRHRRLRTTA